MGNCYANGKGIKKDEAKAFEWYKKSAEQGNSDAQLNLGNCYMNGRGVEKDEVKAFEWYQKAAEKRNSYAQCNLGIWYKIPKLKIPNVHNPGVHILKIVIPKNHYPEFTLSRKAISRMS